MVFKSELGNVNQKKTKAHVLVPKRDGTITFQQTDTQTLSITREHAQQRAGHISTSTLLGLGAVVWEMNIY